MSDTQPNRRRGGIIPGRIITSGTLPDIIEAPFPDRRAIHWVPPDRVTVDEFSIVVTPEVLLETSRHVSQTLEHERGGFLLGNRYRCPNTGREYVIIDQYVEADFTESTDVSLTFTHESWSQLGERLTGKYYGKKLVGWYHSHPRMSIFLSEHDLAIHRERFAEPWMIALVLEPDKHTGGFFVWVEGKLDPNRYVNFYELLEGEGRETVVAWKNYDGVDPLQGSAPSLAAANTLTVGALGGDSPNDGSQAAVVTPPPRYGWLPDWLQGNLSYFGLTALAVAVFFATLGAVFVWPRFRAWWAPSPPPAEQRADFFKNFDFKLEDRGAVDFRDGRIAVRLNLMNLPEEVARGLKTSVSIDGQEAIVNQTPNGSDVIVEAAVTLSNKVRELEAAGDRSPIGLQIKGVCEYYNARQPFALTVARMQVLRGEAMNLDLTGIKPQPVVPPPGPKPPDRADRNDKNDKGGRPNRPDKNEGKTDRDDRADRGNKADRQDERNDPQPEKRKSEIEKLKGQVSNLIEQLKGNLTPKDRRDKKRELEAKNNRLQQLQKVRPEN